MKTDKGKLFAAFNGSMVMETVAESPSGAAVKLLKIKKLLPRRRGAVKLEVALDAWLKVKGQGYSIKGIVLETAE